jgi:hypothetical protein
MQRNTRSIFSKLYHRRRSRSKYVLLQVKVLIPTYEQLEVAKCKSCIPESQSLLPHFALRSKTSAIIAISFKFNGLFDAFMTNLSVHPQSGHSYFIGVTAK